MSTHKNSRENKREASPSSSISIPLVVLLFRAARLFVYFSLSVRARVFLVRRGKKEPPRAKVLVKEYLFYNLIKRERSPL